MQDTAIRRLEMGRRVEDFIQQQATRFSASSRGSELILAINRAVAMLEDEGAKQEAAERAGREATRQKDAAFATLLDQLRAINLTARGMNKLRPGIASLFRMPRGNGDQATLNAARAFITEATPITSEFINRGLPANFVTTLEATIAEVLSINGRQNEARNQQTSSTAAIKAAQQQLIDAVREFSPIVRNTFHGDPHLLAAWESASHVERAPRRARTTTKATTPTEDNK